MTKRNGLREVERAPVWKAGGPGPRPLFALNLLGYFGHITLPPWASASSAQRVGIK